MHTTPRAALDGCHGHQDSRAATTVWWQLQASRSFCTPWRWLQPAPPWLGPARHWAESVPLPSWSLLEGSPRARGPGCGIIAADSRVRSAPGAACSASSASGTSGAQPLPLSRPPATPPPRSGGQSSIRGNAVSGEGSWWACAREPGGGASGGGAHGVHLQPPEQPARPPGRSMAVRYR